MRWTDYGLKKMNKMDYALKKMNQMDYGPKEINGNVTRVEVRLSGNVMI